MHIVVYVNHLLMRGNDLLCNTVAAGVMNSVSIFWHGVKVDRPPEVTPV